MSKSWKIGMVGLGKLGLPVALAMSLKGHDVMGYDINPDRMQKESFKEQERGPNGEPSIEPLLQKSNLKFGTLREVVEHSEIIFVAVQTPHDPKFEGVTRLPKERVDFDYNYLKLAIHRISGILEDLAEDKVVVIISTVLPGTIRREIIPILDRHVKLVYNPFFIAMGTTIQDFLYPEFVLLGYEKWKDAVTVYNFYATIHDKQCFFAPTVSAELIKVAYNTFISMKICFANTLMEICHKTPGCNVDAVTGTYGALSMANERLFSSRYTNGGMGDGGGCHPRDNIAMSWLAREKKLSYDFFENLMLCREKQTEWLADLIQQYGNEVCILGRSFKAETNLTIGSPAILLENILKERGVKVHSFDPQICALPTSEAQNCSLFFVATNHDYFVHVKFPNGSIVIDPWRYIPQQEGVNVVWVGVGKEEKTDAQSGVSRELRPGL